MLENFKKRDIISILIIIMPLIDIFNTITGLGISLLYRGIFLFILMILFLINNDSRFKKKSLVLLALLFIFCCIYLIHYYSINGLFNIKNELITLIKFIYLPVLTIGLINYYSNRNILMSELITRIMFVYEILIIVPIILGISLNSYEYAKLGYSGLFYSPNELSGILAILIPFAILIFQKHPKKLINILNIILMIICCFLIGTKTPVLSLFISLIMSMVILIIQLILKEKVLKKILLTIVIFLVCCLFYPKSYLKYNMNYQSDSYNTNQKPTINDYNNLNETEKVNELYLYNQIINFPTKNLSFEIQDNKILNMIFSSRNIYLQQNLNKFNNTILEKKLFGLTLGATENNVTGSNMSELDIIDILMYYGIVGAIIFLGYIFVFIIKLIIKFFKKFKNNIKDYELCSACLSLAISLMISFTAGHTLSAPAVSIFIAINMTYIFYKLNMFSTKKKSIPYKAVTIGVSILLVSSIVLIFSTKKNYYELTINMEDNTLTFNKDVQKVEKQIIEYNDIKDTLYYYVINGYKNIDIIYVIRELSENENIQFITINNNEKINLNVNIEISKKIKDSNKNTFYLKDGTQKVVSDSYIYNEKKVNVKKYNKNIAKHLENQNSDYSQMDNNLSKTISLASNTSSDFYIINTTKNIPLENIDLLWLSYSGIYRKDKDIYYKNLETLDLNNKNKEIESILNKNYLMTLYRYTNYQNEIWYKDYQDLNSTSITTNNLYIDSSMNKNIYQSLETLNITNNGYKKFAEALKEEYKNKNYIETNNGIIFSNLMAPSLKNQISNVIILLKNYNKYADYEAKKIAIKLLNELSSSDWVKEENTFYEYITTDLKYTGKISGQDLKKDLLELEEILKEAKISNSEIKNYISLIESSEK